MIINDEYLDNIARLSSIEIRPNERPQFISDLNAIVHFIEQLRTVDTHHLAPLSHPLEISSELRTDCVNQTSCVTALSQASSCFDANLYWVPKIIEPSR